jgi:hypothetical protein
MYVGEKSLQEERSLNQYIYEGKISRTEFGYKPVCSQLATTHYVTTNKIIYVYFSHMTNLMSHVIFLNNTCG